jgi:hypothetical protein
LERPRCWIRSPQRPARLLVADSGARILRQTRVVGKLHQQSRPRFDAQRPSGFIAQGLHSQPAEERLQNPLQKGQTPHLELHFSEALLALWKSHGAGFVRVPGRRVFSVANSGGQIPLARGAKTLVARGQVSPQKRRAGPQAVDCGRSRTPTRRGKASKPAAKVAESAP